jgi:hypothetical protein
MSKLQVFVGPHPSQMTRAIINDVNYPTVIKTSVFDGDISVFVDMTPDKTMRPLPNKNFTVQVNGRYLPWESNQRDSGITRKQCWTFDDVMFGIELDCPVRWGSVPLPKILAKGLS